MSHTPPHVCHVVMKVPSPDMSRCVTPNPNFNTDPDPDPDPDPNPNT